MLQILGVLIALVLIMVLSVRKVKFGISIIIGSLVICVFSGVSPDRFARILVSVFQDNSTYEVVFDVALIGILGYILKETQLITDMIQALSKLLPRKALLALIPAIFGIMPMPGGALISAPLIDKEASELGLTAEKKTFVNLWFRHIWFFILPISSSFVLAARLSKINPYDLIIIQMPTFLFMTLLGILFLRYGIRTNLEHLEGNVSYRALILGIAPILLAVVLNIIGVWLPIALSLGILTVFLIKREKLSLAPSLLWKGLNKELAFATFTVMVFRYLIQDTNAFREIFATLQGLGIPTMFFLTVFPFLLGFVAAIPTSGIGVGFSLVLPMFPNISLPMISIMYQSIIIGYELSPLHLCLVLTNEYYHSKLQQVYRLWGPLVLTTYLFGLATPIIYQMLFP